MRVGCSISVFLGLCALSTNARAQITWTEITTLNGKNPALAAGPNGGVHIVVADDIVHYVELDASGGSLVDEDVPGTNGAASGFSFGPAVAAGTGAIHVAFAEDQGNTILRGFHVAKIGGTWSSLLELQPATERGYAPSIAMDETGAAHVLFGAVTSVPYGVANYYRVSGGVVVDSKPGVVEWRVDDRNAIVTGPNGSIYAFGGYPSPSGEIHVASSTNGGVAFSSPIEIQPPNVGSLRVGQPHAVADPSGVVHLVYGAGEESGTDCNGCAVHYAALSGGAVTETSVVNASGFSIWHLSLAIARIARLDSGLRVVAWQAHAGDDSAAPVSASTSSDGKTWTAGQSVVGDCGGSEGRNTIDLVGSGSTVWLACPKGSSTRIFRGVPGSSVPCNPASPFGTPSIEPASGSGPAQAFTTRMTHCEGASAFRIVQLRVTKVVDAQEPALAPSFEAGAFHLDEQSCAPGESTTLTSTYGTLDCATSSVTDNGNERLVKFSVAFDTTSFAGERGLFVDAKGGSVSPEPRLGWTQVGTWTVSTEWSDGGVIGMGGNGGSAGARGGVTEEESGCGCRAAGRTGSPIAALLALAGLSAARSFRARSRRSPSARRPR